jgi:arginase family enzyme
MLTIYQGRAGDRNERALAGSVLLGDAIASQFELVQHLIGRPQPPLHTRWDAELAAARADLGRLGHAYEQLLQQERRPLAIIGRCAAALATLPVIAQHRPDACIVWFDAHADSNTPQSLPNPYLGGMVLSAAAGLWDSGLGAGLPWANIVLVGSRDIDPDEQQLIDSGRLRLVKVGTDLPQRLQVAVAGRPVYVHLDCDVLEPGIVPTEYLAPGGLALSDLQDAFAVLARHELIGLEIAEFEATWPNDTEPVSPAALVAALTPVLGILCHEPSRS